MEDVKKAYEFIENAKLAVRQGRTISHPTQEQLNAHKENKLSFGEKLADYSEKQKASNYYF